MNATPHTHNLRIEESTAGWTAMRIQYGDQPTHYVYTWCPGWRSRTRRVAKRTVRRHDRQSLKAARRASTTKTLIETMGLWERSGMWGRDVLTGTPLSSIEATLRREISSGCWSLTASTGPTKYPQYFQFKAAALEYAAANGYVLTEEETRVN